MISKLQITSSDAFFQKHPLVPKEGVVTLSFINHVIWLVHRAMLQYSMNIRGFMTVVLMSSFLLDIHPSSHAADTNLHSFAAQNERLLSKQIETESADAIAYAAKLASTYTSKYPNAENLDDLTPTTLRLLIIQKPEELAPKLLFLMQGLADDDDCDRWFRNLKAAYTLSTNDMQRATCLVFATGNTITLERKPFGRKMLAEISSWLKQEQGKNKSMLVEQKLRVMIVFTALGLNDYETVSTLAIDTPFRAAAPLWMMSKGKWELALAEIEKVRKQKDITADETGLLDGLEPIVRGVAEKRAIKQSGGKTP